MVSVEDDVYIKGRQKSKWERGKVGVKKAARESLRQKKLYRKTGRDRKIERDMPPHW